MNDEYELDFSEINAIVKRRYETGDYSTCSLRMGRWVLDEMRKNVPTPSTAGYLLATPIGDLIGIPVVVDDTIKFGWWQLVQRRVVPDGGGYRTEESVIKEGTIR